MLSVENTSSNTTHLKQQQVEALKIHLYILATSFSSGHYGYISIYRLLIIDNRFTNNIYIILSPYLPTNVSTYLSISTYTYKDRSIYPYINVYIERSRHRDYLCGCRERYLYICISGER